MEVSVFCISLSRRKDRRFFLEKGLKQILGQPIAFLEAVDGSRILKKRLKRLPKGTSPSFYAVRLSQRLALRKFVQSVRSEDERLLLLEDDVAFSPDFEDVLTKALLADADLVFLGGTHLKPPEAIKGEFWMKCTSLYDNHAIVFTCEGARKTLSMLGEWRVSGNDIEISKNIEEGKLLALCPPEWVAFQRNTKSDNCGLHRHASFAEGAIPYMLGDDLAVLDAALNDAKVVVEYGSGASTVHIGNRLRDWGTLVSVTHLRKWHKKVKSVLDDQKLDHVNLLLREPHAGKAIKRSQRFSERALASYIAAPGGEVEAGSVDLVFIDGRQRINCALAAAKLLKKGGYLMIHDFWPRFRYRARLPELLAHYDYLLESPCLEEDQGLAVFVKR